MSGDHVVHLGNEDGEGLRVELHEEGDRQVAVLTIDGAFYHLERMRRCTLMREYVLDGDPDYIPRTDSEGCCLVMVPFSE